MYETLLVHDLVVCLHYCSHGENKQGPRYSRSQKTSTRISGFSRFPYEYLYICIYRYIHINIYIYIYLYFCIHIYIYRDMHIFILTTCISCHIYMYMCMYASCQQYTPWLTQAQSTGLYEGRTPSFTVLYNP